MTVPGPPDSMITIMKKASKSDIERVADDGSLVKYSKRLERQQKKQQLKRSKPALEHRRFLGMPFDILIQIFNILRPSDVFRLARTCHSLRDFVEEHEERIARNIIRWRYPCLEKCIRLPVLLQNVDKSLHAVLQDPQRHSKLSIHKRPYQHIKAADPTLVCSCLTCVLRWNILCLALDFAHWQGHLDKGEPLPVIDKGRAPRWNRLLVEGHAAIVTKALSSPLLYACILEAHLSSTVRSIHRQGENKGNQRRRFRMTSEDEASGTDVFLERSGPPSVDFPYMRDNYYMLEAYLPNRCWIKEREAWAYMGADQHNKDLEHIKNWAQHKASDQEDKGQSDQKSSKQAGDRPKDYEGGF